MKSFVYTLLLLSSFALAEPGEVIRKTELREKPYLDSTVLLNITANTPVDIRSRKGAWMEVRLAGGQTGWIKLLNVRTSSGSTSSSNALSNVMKTGSSGKTVTTGVKGLSAEQIKNAVPNLAEVNKMNSFAARPADAIKGAQANRLLAANVPELSSTGTGTGNTDSNYNPNQRRP
ncbi:SH3 domain-containing protein [Chitinibacter sp. S2-10]|uniref:SH3 domain-containing protein n=1 Tax=Chitinibacter sp. S2-10 TaxID=3373597 RepID=UPI003977D664